LSRGRNPLISIGLPVFNGEEYLSQAIESVLAQTFTDLELVLSDNASTDRTEEICREFAGRDPRVRYSRNDRNLGAAPNYNRAFALSSGSYFKWAAHDDTLDPAYLETCWRRLDAEPDAVLCQSLIHYIDSEGRTLGTYDSRILGSDAGEPSTRFAAVILRPHPCNEFFGLIRRSALEGSLLHGSFHGADRALLAQLALRGKLLQVGEPLLRMREHPTRYTRSATRPRDRLAWHDASRAGQRELATWRVYSEYIRMVRNEKLDPGERRRCRRHLFRWWFSNWNSARLAVDGLGAVFPGAPAVAERFKQRLFQPAPGWGAYDRGKRGRRDAAPRR
jgi:glycosyltransferase involved in cell wall biosynthesis